MEQFEVELVIKAVDEATKNLKGIYGSMSELEKGVDKLLNAIKDSTPANQKYMYSLMNITKAYDNFEITGEEATKQLLALKAEMNAGAGATESSTLSWTDLKSAIDLSIGSIRQVIEVVKQAREFGELGAQVNQTTESFDLFVTRLGISTEILDQLREASRGTVDDMTAMAAVTRLAMGAEDDLARALVNATPQLMDLAKAANKINPALGDTSFLFDSLATGIKRGSPMILDNMGLVLKLGEANEEYAASLGKSADQLTSTEQKVALLNAVLAASDQFMKQAGGSADSATDAYKRQEVAIENARAKLASYTQLVDKASGWGKILEKQTIAQNKALAGEKEQLDRVVPAMKEDADATGELYDQLWPMADVQERVATETALANIALAAQKLALERDVTAFEEAKSAAEEWYSVQEELVQARDDLAEAEANWAKTVGQDVKGAFDQVYMSSAKYREGLKLIDEALGTNLSQQQSYQDELLQLAKDFASGKLDPEEFKAKLVTLKDAYKPLEEGITDAMTKISDLEAQLASLSKRHFPTYLDIIATVNGMIAGSTGSTPGKGGKTQGKKGKQYGGPVMGNQAYVVGERGPELFVPNTTGSIVPNSKLGAGGGYAPMTVIIQNNTRAAAALAGAQLRSARRSQLNAQMGG